MVALLVGVAMLATTCVGDCNGDGAVRVNELVQGVEINLGLVPATTCEAIECNGGRLGVYIDCMVTAVHNALTACPRVPSPTPTPTPAD